MTWQTATKRRPAPLKVDTRTLLPIVTPPGSSRFQEDFNAPFSESFAGLDTSSPTTIADSSQSRRSLGSDGEASSRTLSPTSAISTWSSTSWRSLTGDRFREWARHPIRALRRGSAKLGRSKGSTFRESDSSLRGEQLNDPQHTECLKSAPNIPEAWWKIAPRDLNFSLS